MSPVEELAARIVDAAGGIDEVRRLAELGWPETRELDVGDLDEAEVREAIVERAKAIVARVDADAETDGSPREVSR